jgi:hypothetical protein
VILKHDENVTLRTSHNYEAAAYLSASIGANKLFTLTTPFTLIDVLEINSASFNGKMTCERRSEEENSMKLSLSLVPH